MLKHAGMAVVNYQSKKYQFEHGENTSGFEIKFDNELKNTGNIYIETHEKADPNNLYFIPSGINRRDAHWYVIGDYNTIILFSIHLLRMIEKNFKHVQIPTSKGFLIPFEDAVSFADKVIRPNEKKLNAFHKEKKK